MTRLPTTETVLDVLISKAWLMNAVEDQAHLLGLEMSQELMDILIQAKRQCQLDRVRMVLADLRYSTRQERKRGTK